MPVTRVPQTPVCGLPGCNEPRLIVSDLCDCEEDECPGRHVEPECCKRHSGNSAGGEFWIPNDGIIDQRAIDMVIHEERVVPLTWVEALIVIAVLLALGYSVNDTTRRLGFDANVYRHGVLRGALAKEDLARAVAAIQGLPVPSVRVPRARKSDAELHRARRAAMTPEQKALELERDRVRKAKLKVAAFGEEVS